MAKQDSPWSRPPDLLLPTLLRRQLQASPFRPVSCSELLTSLVDNDLTAKWLARLRQTATTNESREQHSQLWSILDYYNKEATQAKDLPAIDWDHYKKNIHTPGVVDKIKGKYD